MGKSCDFSKQRKCLMKTLQKLTEKLGNSPPCRVKPFPCTPCCPMGAFLPCGPPQCKCCLVRKCCSECPDTSPPTPCGPFPDSCVSICSPASPNRSQQPCCCRCKKSCSSKCCCTPKRCICRCCCMPCAPQPTMCLKRCCPILCKPKCCCCCCKCQPPKCCRVEYKKSPGNLCCGCNAICVPRCKSDTRALVPKKRGRALTCSKSVELRGGVLYRGCDCDKRNGLQDRCLRWCCINNPSCRTNPPSCHCSKFSCGKHLSVRDGKNRSISYTCCICGPPMCPCMPCCPAICCCPCTCCCRCNCCCCCCQKKCECECQCCPSTCEVECCCCQPCSCPEPLLPCSKPCLPCPESCSPCPKPCSPCPEPCEPCPEPCEPCPSPEPCCPPPPCPEACLPCLESTSPPMAQCCTCGTTCACNGGTQTIGDAGSCYIEYSPPKCRTCQTCQCQSCQCQI